MEAEQQVSLFDDADEGNLAIRRGERWFGLVPLDENGALAASSPENSASAQTPVESEAEADAEALPELRQRGPRSRNASPRIASGEVRMQTVYVTPDDQDRAMDAVVKLKKTRALRGQIGFSFAVRIGLRLLEQELQKNARSVLAIAQELAP